MIKSDIIVVGTGFASSFFLKRYLERAPKNASVLVLERGERRPYHWHTENKAVLHCDSQAAVVNNRPEKEWHFALTFGGTSLWWWACTPRMMPNDFLLHTKYGVGHDWPLTYEELEPYYEQAEEIMQVSGKREDSLHPRRGDYPQPPHLLSEPDKILQRSYGPLFIPQPTARSRRPTSKRPLCCATGICHSCPTQAKFTVLNELSNIYDDPRVRLELGAEVTAVDIANGVAKGVHFEKGGRSERAQSDLVALGANAVFNAAILLNSSVEHPLLGVGLNEQRGLEYIFDLDGVDSFQGSTSITGHGYMLYDGPHRSERAAGVMEVWNVPLIRTEQGRWQQRLQVKFIFEELPGAADTVTLPEGQRIPELNFSGLSDYVEKGMQHAGDNLERILSAVPIERIVSRRVLPTEGHILGMTRMGRQRDEGVADRYSRLFDASNVLVLGGGVFPTYAPANPTLTLSALSLQAADALFQGVQS